MAHGLPRTGWSRPVGLYLGLLAVVTAVSWLAMQHLGPGIGKSYFGFKGGALLAGWAQWDAGWYYHISKFGYSHHRPGTQSPVAFFPGYAMAMRYGSWFTGDRGSAGYLTTIACGMGSAVAFWIWCRDRVSQRAATTAVVVLLVYPYSYYLYGAMYGTALFLFATLVAFLALERDQVLLAGLAGAVAGYTRFVGVAVVIGLTIRLLEQRGALRRPGWLGIPTRIQLGGLRPKDGLILLSCSGLASYVGFLWSEFGNPLLFSSVQHQWGQSPGMRTWLKAEFVDRLTSQPDQLFTWGLAAQGALALCALTAVPLIGQRFGWGYATYTAVALSIPLLGSKDFQGLGRYLIAAFPVFAIGGVALAEHPKLRPLILSGSAVIMLLMTIGFAHGLYLS